MQKSSDNSWLEIDGEISYQLACSLTSRISDLVLQGVMPANEQERVARHSSAISTASFIVSSERLELLRNLCHLYSVGIRAEKIASHRRLLGPIIVFAKKSVFRVISALLGPSFRYQRDFNAGVIRLLSDLCNENRERKT